mmetsp:Transcript_43048/g.119047  ORF Transcript_43048/g.119047 Transcript_43048/m.119047 type:complete len:222 (+) Transcript_43048:315-980(+)
MQSSATPRVAMQMAHSKSSAMAPCVGASLHGATNMAETPRVAGLPLRVARFLPLSGLVVPRRIGPVMRPPASRSVAPVVLQACRAAETCAADMDGMAFRAAPPPTLAISLPTALGALRGRRTPPLPLGTSPSRHCAARATAVMSAATSGRPCCLWYHAGSGSRGSVEMGDAPAASKSSATATFAASCKGVIMRRPFCLLAGFAPPMRRTRTHSTAPCALAA